jgi:phosphoglycolate phosphatase
VCGVGVAWGYHAPTTLMAADRIIDRFEELPTLLDDIWRQDT